MNFEFTDDMNEISGLGGAHERALRTAVTAGAQWWVAHPEGDPIITGDDATCEAGNGDGESLLRAVNGTIFTGDDGVKVPLGNAMTPSMYYAAMYHVMWIGEHGWNNYVCAMRLPLQFYSDDKPEARNESPS
jgi:hypothetical protein